MKASKMKVAGMLFAAMACGLPLGHAAGQYPEKAVRIVVGYAPGGGNDLMARSFAASLQKSLGQSVVVENRPGADTIIASNLVARSPADGHTLLVNAMGGFSVTPALHQNLPYDPKADFAVVGMIAQFPQVLTVSSSIPSRSLEELVEYVRQRPGELNYGSVSPAMQIATEDFLERAGLKMVHIPYKGSGQASTALLSDEVQLIISDLPPLLAHLEGGRVRPLAVTSDRRLESMPALPTFKETQGFSDFAITPWVGMFAPAGTPQPVIDTLNTELGKFLESPETLERLRTLGAQPLRETPGQATARVAGDLDRYSEMAGKLNLKGSLSR